MEIEKAKKIMEALDKTDPYELSLLSDDKLALINEARNIVNSTKDSESENLVETEYLEDSEEDLPYMEKEMDISEEEEEDVVTQEGEVDSLDLEELADRISEEGLEKIDEEI